MMHVRSGATGAARRSFRRYFVLSRGGPALPGATLGKLGLVRPHGGTLPNGAPGAPERRKIGSPRVAPPDDPMLPPLRADPLATGPMPTMNGAIL